MVMIDTFSGEYEWLSNFYPARIFIKGHGYENVEAAFQAQKCKTEEGKHKYFLAAPSEAKRMGRAEDLVDNWEDIKDNVMLECLREKFQKPNLRSKLLATGNEPLIEGNYWHDNYWGNCTCKRCENIKGLNMLGTLLEIVRDELRKNPHNR